LPNSATNGPLIFGHRGASAVAPENTLAAFSRAFADGAVGIEFDVRLSRDGVPVIVHDSTLRRTGNRDDVVAELEAADLTAVEVGSWFNRTHPDLAQNVFAQQRLPTFSAALRLLQNQRPKPQGVYVELKTDRAASTGKDLAQAVVDLVKQHPLKPQIVVVSFNLQALRIVKQLDSSIRTGALFEPRRSAVKAVRKHPMISAALDCGADQILLHRLIVTRKLVSLAGEAHLLPVVWTVDNPRWVERAIDYGIHALITNDPAKMLASTYESKRPPTRGLKS
jgi:glycerophosphoryl diester phosphodiesterase